MSEVQNPYSAANSVPSVTQHSASHCGASCVFLFVMKQDIQLNVRLPSALRSEIDRAAAKADRSAGYLVRQILERWAEREQRPEAAA